MFLKVGMLGVPAQLSPAQRPGSEHPNPRLLSPGCAERRVVSKAHCQPQKRPTVHPGFSFQMQPAEGTWWEANVLLPENHVFGCPMPTPA